MQSITDSKKEHVINNNVKNNKRRSKEIEFNDYKSALMYTYEQTKKDKCKNI